MLPWSIDHILSMSSTHNESCDEYIHVDISSCHIFSDRPRDLDIIILCRSEKSHSFRVYMSDIIIIRHILSFYHCKRIEGRIERKILCSYSFSESVYLEKTVILNDRCRKMFNIFFYDAIFWIDSEREYISFYYRSVERRKAVIIIHLYHIKSILICFYFLIDKSFCFEKIRTLLNISKIKYNRSNLAVWKSQEEFFAYASSGAQISSHMYSVIRERDIKLFFFF